MTDAQQAPEVDEDELWGASVAEGNQDGLRGGAAAPEDHGGPFGHDVVGDEVTDETPGTAVG